jgi:hypothetical protein
MLPIQAIKEYQQMYKARFGIVLSEEEAVEKANKLVQFYKVLFETTISEERTS